ncbi:MAG: alanine dehydrogenase [Phycisphaerae bacterium]|nr:alanine dehydrogenase [Phycisphaerae bacterium]NUQ45921.1 alanine dehydrogenase [Phycisphaerae bacterium]
MIVGVPREIKTDEYRVGMVPGGVVEMVRAGHKVLVETQAGAGSGFLDEDYQRAGAEILPTAADVFKKAEMIVKVKEPQAVEIAMMREGQVMFTYFHFAAERGLTEGVLKSKSIAIAYETVYDKRGQLPLLTPMSEVAGKMAVQEGAKFLERPMMGRGILLGGVPGVDPGLVVIIGGGVVGTNAAKVAAGLGARVVIFDVNLDRLRYLSDVMPANVQTMFSNPVAIREQVTQADLVIGAVLIPGARCPVLIPREYVKQMKPGSVIVDVGIDQGGCCETIRPTTHADPIFVEHGVVHYGVTNMPGAVSRTSTFALTNATLPYALKIAGLGYREAAKADPGLAAGINMERGKLTNQAVAECFGMPYEPLRV